MLYTFIPLFLILSGLILVLWIILRHFPQLALLDVDSLPQEQQMRTKKALLEQRYQDSMKELGEKFSVVRDPFMKGWKWVQSLFRAKVTKTYTSYKRTQALDARNSKREAAPVEAIAALMKDAETALLAQEYDEAEQRYIEVVRLSPRNVEAYRGLGRLYFEMEQWKEAEEVYLFIVRLDPHDTRALNRLGMIAMEKEQWNDAVRYFKRAVELEGDVAIRHYDLAQAYMKLDKLDLARASFERVFALEPHNPKYLDAFLQLCLAVKDPVRAQELLQEMKIANPDNQKLEDFQHRINELTG